MALVVRCAVVLVLVCILVMECSGAGVSGCAMALVVRCAVVLVLVCILLTECSGAGAWWCLCVRTLNLTKVCSLLYACSCV